MTSVLPIVTNLSARVIRILGCNPGHMTLQGTNSYLIGTGRNRILLDTSEEDKSDYVEELRKVLKKLDVRLETVLISHWHHDHVGSAGAIHSDKNMHADHGCTFHKMQRREFNDTTEGTYGAPMRSLTNGQKFTTEGATVRAIYTPGHTSDHTAFLLEEENAIFTGDCVLGEGTTVFETLSDYMRSLYLLKDLNANIIYPGHGPHSTSPLEHIGRYITNRESREKQIIECLQQNKRLVIQDIVRKIYKELPENLFFAAAQNVNQHLEKLAEEGKVGHNDDAEYFMKQSNKL